MLRLDPPIAERQLESPVENRRRFTRHQIAWRCWIISAPNTVYLPVHDISRGGLSVRAPVPFAVDECVEVRIELPSGAVVHARALVVWTRTVAEGMSGARMGIRFTSFDKNRAAFDSALPA